MARLLERDIFVRNRRTANRRVLWFGRALIKTVAGRRRGDSARAAGVFATTAAFATSAEQNQIVGDDLSPVHLLAGFFVIPGAGAQATLDVALAALFQILANDFSQLLEGHDVVPLGAVLPVAVFVFET